MLRNLCATSEKVGHKGCFATAPSANLLTTLQQKAENKILPGEFIIGDFQ
jgi:hypothetical protein